MSSSGSCTDKGISYIAILSHRSNRRESLSLSCKLTLSSIPLSEMALLMEEKTLPPLWNAGFVVMEPVSEAATEIYFVVHTNLSLLSVLPLTTSSASESNDDRRPNRSCFFFMMRSLNSWELSWSGLGGSRLWSPPVETRLL